VAELLEEKKDAVVNTIASIDVKGMVNPKDSSKFVCFVQSLEVLKEDAERVGNPTKYEAESVAKATVTTSPQGGEQVKTWRNVSLDADSLLMHRAPLSRAVSDPTRQLYDGCAMYGRLQRPAHRRRRRP
jgi:hypothetical protein